jgi:acyl-CoA thioester hydrolase
MIMKPFLHKITVEFCHTDAAGIAHFSALMQYAEQTEHAFLRSLGLTVFSRSSDSLTWPRVKVTAEFQSPAFFEDVLRLELSIERIGETSVTYLITISGPGGVVATCESVCVCCLRSSVSPGRLEKSPIPADIRALLGEFLI